MPRVDDHHVGVDLRHDGVTVSLITITSDPFGMSQRDIELAREISSAARKLGLVADPSKVQTRGPHGSAESGADIATAKGRD